MILALVGQGLAVLAPTHATPPPAPVVPIVAPAPHAAAVVVPAPAHVSPVTTTTTTISATPPVTMSAPAYGPQPIGPSVTTDVIECVVTLTAPDGTVVTYSAGPATNYSCDAYNGTFPAGDAVIMNPIMEPITTGVQN